MRSFLQSAGVQAERWAGALTVRQPALGLRFAALLGTLAAQFAATGRTPSADDVADLCGPLDPGRVESIRRRIARLYFQNQALRELLRQRGLAALLPLVERVDAAPLLRLRAENVPIIVVGWHQGPIRAASLGLRKLGIPALFAMTLPAPAPDDVVRYAQVTDETDSTRFLRLAHQALGDGVVVGLNFDLPRYGEPISFLGRRIRVARGPAVLARLAGARLVPVTRRFLGSTGRFEVTYHEPIDDADLDRSARAAFESELLLRSARWFESHVRSDPASMRPERFARLVAAPLAEGETPEAPDLAALHVRRGEERRTRQRADWESKWASAAFDKPWLGRGISPEIGEAVASGWFPRAARALDAGCGAGEVAAWLALQGHEAVGIDVADAAVARARAAYGERSGELRFARLDLCERPPDGGPFGIIVDRGCFLQIPEADRPRYAAHLAAASAPDARLLLFGRAFRDGIAMGDAEEIRYRRAEVMDAFAPHFELERVAPTYLDRHGGERAQERLPGIVFWLRRRT